MKRFKDALEAELTAALPSFLKEPETYALSFFIEHDHHEGPLIQLSAVTESDYREVRRSEDDLEARWNYAFWPQEPIVEFPQAALAREARDRWLASVPIDFDGPDLDDSEFETFLVAKDRVFARFYDMAAELSLKLHDMGVVGPEVVIVIHDLEYGEREIEATRRGNPRATEECFSW